MIELPEITLIAADTANHALAARALARSTAGIRFARAVWLTDAIPPGVDVPSGIEVLTIPPIDSRAGYSRLVLKGLAPYVATSHVLLVQWDGFVLHPDAWDPRFLECDYLGARWFWHTDGMDVGNGGFSLRSRRLIDALADPRIDGDAAEDELIARTFRPLLERDHGIRFGTAPMAERFSFEVAALPARTFGFHGLYNFPRVMKQHELAPLVAQLSDEVTRSPQCLQLLRNARALSQWQVVRALAQRMLATSPADAEVEAALGEAVARDRPHAAVGRNDPCPCGSGRRFKHCHGSATSGPEAVSVPAAAAASTAPVVDVERLTRRGLDAHRRGEIDAAVRDYRAALALDPGANTATHYLGVAHYQRGNLGDALPLVERSLEIAPHEAEFYNNAGLLYAALDRFDDAVAAHRSALAARDDHVAAWNNLGLALAQRNELDDAIDAYRHALALEPGFAEARWNLALALLARGDYAEGWREYDARLGLDALAGRAKPSPLPRYDGSPLAGKTLLLLAEQGLGDTLQFVRFAQDFAARGARVVVQVPEPLVTLCATAPGVAATIADSAAIPPADFELPLLSVGAVLGIGRDTPTRQRRYITTDPARVERWRAVVRGRRSRLHVGLSWAGNPRMANNRRRSCPLALLAPLFALDGIAWYSLQHIDGEDQIESVPAASSLIRLDARHNFDDKAALMDSLDLVISVCTSTAHLAGALDVPLWALLSYAPDWRWGVATQTTPWYPRARLFRQDVTRTWEAPVAQVRQALCDMLKEHRATR